MQTPDKGLSMKMVTILSALLISNFAFADAQPDQVIKTAPAWGFLMQIAMIKAPIGCTFTTPGMDGTNYDPSKPFTIMLTDSKGNSDSMLVQSTDVFKVVIDMATQVITTSLDVAGKEIVTVGNPPNTPNANTMAVARVGKVTCGLSESQTATDGTCFVNYSHQAGRCNTQAGTDSHAFDTCLASAKDDLKTCCAGGGSPLCTDI
jgi:hypothetical protein